MPPRGDGQRAEADREGDVERCAGRQPSGTTNLNASFEHNRSVTCWRRNHHGASVISQQFRPDLLWLVCFVPFEFKNPCEGCSEWTRSAYIPTATEDVQLTANDLCAVGQKGPESQRSSAFMVRATGPNKLDSIRGAR